MVNREVKTQKCTYIVRLRKMGYLKLFIQDVCTYVHTYVRTQQTTETKDSWFSFFLYNQHLFKIQYDFNITTNKCISYFTFTFVIHFYQSLLNCIHKFSRTYVHRFNLSDKHLHRCHKS